MERMASASEQEVSRSQRHQDLADMLVLIADFLERSVGLKDAANVLRKEVTEAKLLPDTVGWNGDLHAGRLLDHRSLRKLPKDHLLLLLKLMKRFDGNAGDGSRIAEEEEGSSILAAVSNRLTTAVPKMLEADSAKFVNELADLRLKQRQLIRELASDRGRSSTGLTAALNSVTRSIQSLSENLALVANLKSKSSNLNVVDFVNSGVEQAVPTAASNLRISRLSMLRKIIGHRAPAYCASASHPRWIVTAADDNLVKLWDGANSRLHHAFRGHRNVITDLSMTSDLVASASEDNTVRIWEMSSTKPFAVLTQHKQPVQRVQFSADGNFLLSAADDGACCVWDLESLRRQVAEKEAINQVWVSREQERRRHEALSRMTGPAEGAPPPLPEIDEIQLLAECPRTALMFEPPLVFPHCDPQGGIVKIVCMAVHPTGKFVATGGEDHLGRVWSVNEITAQPPPPSATSVPGLIHGEYRNGDSHLLCILSGHTEGYVHHIEWSHKGDRILTFSDKDGTARVWFWPLGDMASKPQHIALKAIVPSTTTAKLGSKSSTKLMPMIDAAGFSLDDSLIITTQSVKPSVYKDEEPGFYDSRVCVWDSRSGSLLRFMRGHRLEAHVIRVHPELNHVASTCGSDGMIFFWNLETGKPLAKFEAISTEGYPSILDARWTNNAEHPADFVATDSMGRLLLVGTGSNKPYEAFPCEQFLSYERTEFILDERTGEALDATLQIPLHLVRQQPLLVDVFEERYAEQPPPLPKGNGTFLQFPSSGPSNYVQRVIQAREKDRYIMAKEEAAMRNETYSELIRKLNEAVLNAVQMDAQESEGGGAARPPPKTVTPRPRAPRARPMLALERVAVESETSSELSDVEDLDDDDQVGRSRRAAARRAKAQIHRQARRFLDTEAEASESTGRRRGRESALDETFTGRRGDDEDDEDEEDSDDEDAFRASRRYRSRSGRNIERRTYETRGHRLDYSEFDEDGDDFTYNRRRRRQHQMELDDLTQGERHVSARQSQSLNDPSRISAPGFSDDWLIQPSEMLAFVPQVGDQVVYFAQGHAEYLRHFPSTTSPPWQSWNSREWPFVVCEVKEVRYEFPPAEEPRQIVCQVSLKVTQVKSPLGSMELYAPLRENEPQIQFQVQYHSFEQEFLVLLARFEAGLKRNTRIGARVEYYVKGEDETDEPILQAAVVKQIAVKDEAQWPDSPWEALVCISEEDGQTEIFLSPWEVESSNGSASSVPVYQIVSEDVIRFREKKVNNVPIQTWIAEEIDNCPLWSAFFRTRRHPSLACFTSLALISSRLRNGNFYRQMEAIRADCTRLIECATFMKTETHPIYAKAERMMIELMEILAFAEEGERAEQGPVEMDGSVLKVLATRLVDEVATVDKESFFQEPVNLDEFPDYTEYVSAPMDFSTAKRRLEETDLHPRGVTFARARRFIRSVVGNVRQIGQNATIYNPESTLAFRRGKEILKKLSDVFASIDVSTVDQNAYRAPRLRRGTLQQQQQQYHQARAARTAVTSRGRVVRAAARFRDLGDESADSLLGDDDDLDEEDEVFSDSDDEEVLPGRRSSRGRRSNRVVAAEAHRRSTRSQGSRSRANSDVQEEFTLPTKRSSRARHQQVDEPESFAHHSPVTTTTTTAISREERLRRRIGRGVNIEDEESPLQQQQQFSNKRNRIAMEEPAKTTTTTTTSESAGRRPTRSSLRSAGPSVMDSEPSVHADESNDDSARASRTRRSVNSARATTSFACAVNGVVDDEEASEPSTAKSKVNKSKVSKQTQEQPVGGRPRRSQVAVSYREEEDSGDDEEEEEEEEVQKEDNDDDSVHKSTPKSNNKRRKISPAKVANLDAPADSSNVNSNGESKRPTRQAKLAAVSRVSADLNAHDSEGEEEDSRGRSRPTRRSRQIH